MKKRVYVGISGGIDSAMSVLLLRQQGYDVVGVTLQMGYTSAESLAQTAELAEKLQIPLLVEDLTEAFDTVIVTPFVASYLAGETPSPCTLCNPRIKWSSLARVAARAGDTDAFLATGHYCRIVEHNGLRYIARGADPTKDQSYYLWMLDQPILRRALMPLGTLYKSTVKEQMRAAGFESLSTKSESMGVCFLCGKGYQAFLLERLPELAKLQGGPLTDRHGHLIGTHDGYPFYTLAQRRGLRFTTPTAPESQGCVICIDKEQNRLILGDKSALYTSTLRLRDFRITNSEEFFTSSRLVAKVRGIGENPQGFCRVVTTNECLTVTLDHPAWALTPGQSVIFYIDDRVVGGGIVTETFPLSGK